MKRFLATAMCLALLIAEAAPAASARGHNYYGRSNYGRNRTAVKVGVGAAIGAGIGGLIGGRKGAVIGGLAGAGGGYIWSRRNNNRYYQRPYYGNQRPYYNNQQPYYNSYPPRH